MTDDEGRARTTGGDDDEGATTSANDRGRGDAGGDRRAGVRGERSARASRARGREHLGVIATALFIIIPTAFLIVLYVKSSSEGNVSGGFSQEYYDKSKKRGDKKTNEAAVLKGKGLGMRPEK